MVVVLALVVVVVVGGGIAAAAVAPATCHDFDERSEVDPKLQNLVHTMYIPNHIHMHTKPSNGCVGMYVYEYLRVFGR